MHDEGTRRIGWLASLASLLMESVNPSVVDSPRFDLIRSMDLDSSALWDALASAESSPIRSASKRSAIP